MVKSIVDSRSVSSGIVLDLTKRELLRILHVDSDPVFLKVAKQCLEIEGRFQVDTMLSVEEAMEKMKKETYDAVVSDYVMPGKDGLDFLKELRDARNSIPFIMFTGKGREEIAIKALNLGADGYFSKIASPETVYGELAHRICQTVKSKRAREALMTNESYLKAVLDSMFTGLIVIDEETHKIVDANSHALETIGASREGVIGKVCYRFICPAEEGKCPITDLGQTVDRSDRVLLRADGQRIPILRTVTTIIWRGRKYLIESFIDISERKKTEKALLRSEERFSTLMEEAPIGICNTDLRGKITYVNKRFEEATGYSREEIVGKNGFKIGIMSDETLKLLMKRIKERLTGNPSHRLEGRFKRKDGEWIWAEVEGRLIKKFGVPVGFQLTTRDITERKRAEEERKRYEEKLSALNTHSRKLNTAKSMEEMYRLTMDAVEKTLGFEIAFFMIVDKDMLRVVDHRGYPECFSIELPLNGTKRGVSVKVVKTGRSINVLDAEKEDAWVEFMPGIRSGLDVPVKIGSKVLGVIGVDSKELNAFNEKDQELLEILASHAATAMSNLEHAKNLYRDIAERKRYEKSLSALNSYSRNLNMARSMKEIYELTLDAAEKTLKFEFADIFMVEGKMLRLVTHRGETKISSLELPLDGDRGITVRTARTGKPVLVPDISEETAYVEGEEGARSELVVPIKIGPRVLGALNVESKKLDAFNEKDQELLEILASHAATAISNLEYSRNLEAYAREILESQQRFERLFMDNPEAAVHLDSSFHILNVNPRFMRLFGYSLDEIRGKHINDVVVPKDKMEEAVTFDERASKGEAYHEDTVRRRKDGSLVPVAFSAAPIIVGNQVIGHIAVYKDISELKKAEEELRQTLEKLAKMNEKLRVVGGLTRHDARNKLSAITGNVYLAKKKLASDSEVLNNLKEMELAVAQIVGIFDFAKAYELLGVEELRFIDVGKMIDEAVSLFSDLKGVKVINNCRGLAVLADSLLRQLFYNLVDNSLKYGEKTKTITMYYQEIDKDKLKLVYEDDGVGMGESEKKKLFQEGYGRGTGYGLYLIRKMSEGYGWKIQETGKEGEGAQFTITVPRIGEKRETNYSIS